jgi:hypothetical protein
VLHLRSLVRAALLTFPGSRRMLLRATATCSLAAGVALGAAGVGATAPTTPPLPVIRQTIRQVDGHSARIALYPSPNARHAPRPALLTLGGPIYCQQLENLARFLDASLLCADYWRNKYVGPGLRNARFNDWGDPAYLDAVATLPERARAAGIKISQLLVVGVSYSGFANAELVATHPALRPAALIVVDSYLDLTARIAALPESHVTYKEIVTVLGGTPAAKPAEYAARSPSNHLDGLATAIRGGTRFVDVWSVAPAERREFAGATCGIDANARWLGNLAGLLGAPVEGYVTHLGHAHALWNHGGSLLRLAGFAPKALPLAARTIVFRPGAPVSPGSYCA